MGKIKNAYSFSFSAVCYVFGNKTKIKQTSKRNSENIKRKRIKLVYPFLCSQWKYEPDRTNHAASFPWGALAAQEGKTCCWRPWARPRSLDWVAPLVRVPSPRATVHPSQGTWRNQPIDAYKMEQATVSLSHTLNQCLKREKTPSLPQSFLLPVMILFIAISCQTPWDTGILGAKCRSSQAHGNLPHNSSGCPLAAGFPLLWIASAQAGDEPVTLSQGQQATNQVLKSPGQASLSTYFRNHESPPL